MIIDSNVLWTAAVVQALKTLYISQFWCVCNLYIYMQIYTFKNILLWTLFYSPLQVDDPHCIKIVTLKQSCTCSTSLSFIPTMCSSVLLSLRDPTMPTTDTVNITRPSRMSTTAGARKSPSRVRFFCLSTSAYTPTHSTQRPISWRGRGREGSWHKNLGELQIVLSFMNYINPHVSFGTYFMSF